MKNDFRDFLTDILGYSENARNLVITHKMSELAEKYSPSGMALERSLEIIGEAVKQIPQKIRDQYPEIPWKQVAGLRDVLIHRYWSAQMARLVDIAENYLPDLERVVKQILEDHNLEE